jgi:NAD(P)-dependent dehydrogenase (short-subunit alcohol dehydrogenase family)
MGYKIPSGFKLQVENLKEFDEINGIVCNAGISYEGNFRYTKNGIEETFGTNYLGHFLLTNLLLEKYQLERIVLISSELHNPANKSPFAKAQFKPVMELAHPKIDKSTSLEKQTQSFYATSKLCMILFGYELHRRLSAKGLANRTLVNSINPGLMLSTNLGRKYKIGEKLYRKTLDFFFKIIGLSDNPKSSAKAVAYLVNGTTTSGKYFHKNKRIKSSKDSYDLQKALQLWEGSEVLVGETFLPESTQSESTAV